MKKISKLLVYLKPFKKSVILNITFNLLSVVFSLFSVATAIPLLGIIFNTQELVTNAEEFKFSISWLIHYFQFYLSKIIIEQGAGTALVFVGVVSIIMTLFKTLFRYLAMYNLAPIRNGVPKLIRDKIFAKVLKLPMSYFSNEKKGDIMSRMTSDVQEIEWSLVASIEMIFRDPLTIIIYLVSLFWMSYQLTFFVLILLPISGLIIGRIGKNLRKTSLKGQKRMGVLLSIMEETLTGMRIIKAFNAQEKVSRRFKSINSFYTRIMIKMFRRRYLANPLSEFMGTTVMVVIMIYGGNLVLNSQGNMTSQEFMGYLLLFYLIIPPSKSFSTAYYNMQKGLASVDRINQILKAEEKIIENVDAKQIKEFKESIEFKNVHFKYDKDEILKNINLKIYKGQMVAFVGQSGSGKTTLVDLLPRFYDCTEGEIFIDGENIKNLKIKDLRDLMGNVNQTPILFNDSFYNNIAFGFENAPEKDVFNAAKVANAEEFIKATKYDYYTNIGDGGNKLSGGQRQRISIARAVLKNPPILILDEATSSLDTQSEKLVQEALNKLMENRTSLVVAHRLSTIINADLICVVNEGEIVEMGKHDELIQKNGYFKKLYDLQMFK